ncbi:uncharacterized [Tachysurus ichikawai]
MQTRRGAAVQHDVAIETERPCSSPMCPGPQPPSSMQAGPLNFPDPWGLLLTGSIDWDKWESAKLLGTPL